MMLEDPIDTHDDLHGGGSPCKTDNEAVGLMECLNVWMGVFEGKKLVSVYSNKRSQKFAICICTVSAREKKCIIDDYRSHPAFYHAFFCFCFPFVKTSETAVQVRPLNH
jgi:hypothetical protein